MISYTQSIFPKFKFYVKQESTPLRKSIPVKNFEQIFNTIAIKTRKDSYIMTTPKTHSLEELLGKQYSEALLQMDRNTVNYMIEDMKKELAPTCS